MAVSEQGERADTTQAEEAQEEQPACDLVIFCHPRNVGNLVQSFEDEIKHADGALPMFVLWSGVSGLLHQGVIVLECEGQLPAAFVHNLAIDHEIFDYVVYDWIKSVGSKQEEETAQSQVGDKAAGRPFV